MQSLRKSRQKQACQGYANVRKHSANLKSVCLRKCDKIFVVLLEKERDGAKKHMAHIDDMGKSFGKNTHRT